MKNNLSFSEKIKIFYLNFIKENLRLPTQTDILAQFGLGRHIIRYYFGSIEKLHDMMRREYSDFFQNEINNARFIDKESKKIDSFLKNYSRFVVVSAILGDPLHKKFFLSLQNYCRVNQACIIVIPLLKNNTNVFVDDDLCKHNNVAILTKNAIINQNLVVSSLKLQYNSVDPIARLLRLGERSCSFIYGAPKQRLKLVATQKNTLPHAVMTTGSLTLANYTNVVNPTNKIINETDHVVGAIVVERENNIIYHFRQIQCFSDTGEFCDLGIKYFPKKYKKFSPEAFVLGDIHVTETDASADAAWKSVTKYVKPKYIFVHDLFSGVSINHHEQNLLVTRAKLAVNNHLSLENELKQVSCYLNGWLDLVKKIFVVASNHHDFLSKHYLDRGSFYNDPQNFFIASQLAVAMKNHNNPLQYAIEKLIGLSDPKKVVWLDRDDSFKIAGIELAAHGDIGLNGRPATILSLEKAFLKSVTGHTHTPEILRGAWSVGTTSKLSLRYNYGPSSWLHSSCLVYKNGARQLINSINGSWHNNVLAKKFFKQTK